MIHDTPNNCFAFISKLLMNKGLTFSLATDLGPAFTFFIALDQI